jgi:hypothetical protein
MRISTLAVFLFLLFQVACTKSQIQNIHIEGDLIAKQIITARYDLPSGYISPEISWYISKSTEGEWEKLSGIWTNQIVLITSYVGKYLKFEVSVQSENSGEKLIASVISSGPVVFRGNPNTDWYHDAGFGIMFHYLKPMFVPDSGLFAYLGEKWGGKGQQFKTEVLTSKAKQIVEKGGVLCLEVAMDVKGNILPLHLSQVQAVGKALGKGR